MVRRIDDEEVKSYKWLKLKPDGKNPPNSVIYVLSADSTAIEGYITDKYGNPKPLNSISVIDIEKALSSDIHNLIYVSDGKINTKEIVGLGDIKVNYVNNKVQITFNGQDYAKKSDIPKKTSDLVNDSGFITASDVIVPKKTSNLINDGENGIDKFITSADIAGKIFPFSGKTIVPINHGENRYVTVDVIIGVSKVIADVDYMVDKNNIIVKFGRPETGLIIIN